MEILGHGVCRLAVVSIRAHHQEASEQISQLLFGDHYEVLQVSPDKKWVRIRIYTDQCEGWLDIRQHHPISQEYFDQINQTDYKITTEVASPVLFKKSPFTVVMGSIVPISSSELFKIEEQFAFNGESKGLGQKRDVDFLKTVAGKYLSAPHQPGGKSPFGIDAAGLVHMVFKITGYPTPRELKKQVIHGKEILFKESKPGDVVLFSEKSGGPPAHTGIIYDEARVIHSYGHVRLDVLTEDGIINSETKIFTHWLHSVRRIF